MNKRKYAFNGFTLIEVLVTSVIIAIIGIAAVVAYSGYIKQSRQQTVDNLADAAVVAIQAYIRKTGSDADLEGHPNFLIDLPGDGQFELYVCNGDDYVQITDTQHEGIQAIKHY